MSPSAHDVGDPSGTRSRLRPRYQRGAALERCLFRVGAQRPAARHRPAGAATTWPLWRLRRAGRVSIGWSLTSPPTCAVPSPRSRPG